MLKQVIHIATTVLYRVKNVPEIFSRKPKASGMFVIRSQPPALA
jgi:hypothetical protein